MHRGSSNTVAPASLPQSTTRSKEPAIVAETVSTGPDTAASYAHQREQSDRNRRRADPEIQDRSYGFGNNTDDMDVEMDVPTPNETMPRPEPPRPVSSRPEPPRSESHRSGPSRVDPPRPSRPDDRAYGRRDYAPRDSGWNRYDDRDRDRVRGGGPPRDDRRLYSDELYQRPRGRGFR